MKNLLYVLTAIFMVSCGSNSSKNSNYEQTIREYLLKGKSVADLNFKVEELTEYGTITVADSIAYLTDEFRKDKQLIINRIELAKDMSKELLEKTKDEKYTADIARMDHRIDSLKDLTPDNLRGYDSKNSNDILAIIVRCKYSVQFSGTTPVVETFDFYLSPDGNKCYGKSRAK